MATKMFDKPHIWRNPLTGSWLCNVVFGCRPGWAEQTGTVAEAVHAAYFDWRNKNPDWRPQGAPSINEAQPHNVEK